MNIVLIGSGNVATHLGKALVECGLTVTQVMSKTENNARHLAQAVGAPSFVTSVDKLMRNADLYLLSVTDCALTTLAQTAAGVNPHAVWVHTAGSVAMEVLRPLGNQIGVFYPLQTFSKATQITFSNVPLFLEGATEQVRQLLANIALQLNCSYQYLDSDARQRMHIAAVVACNFSNHLYTLAAELLERDGVAFNTLYPLIEETVTKLRSLTPRQAQTGPAVRGDKAVIASHLIALPNPTLRNIYALLSQNIQHTHASHTQPEEQTIAYDLTQIKAMLFDVDGVLSSDYLSIGSEGLPHRTANIKDGYALQLAVKKGFQVGIITGGTMEAVRRRYVDLGLQHIYMGACHKVASLQDFYSKSGLRMEEVLYVGDDIPDLTLSPLVGLFCAPSDASPEVRQAAQYISPREGGRGVARDIIHQVLQAHSLWLDDDAYCW